MTEKIPIVSVIIPTYNRAQLIGRSIQSVLTQTYHDFELIIVDDGSIDNTGDLIKKIADERIKYIRHETNKGGNAARNTGIKLARGEYIAFQDSDDEWMPEKLEKQINAFKTVSPQVGVVYTGFYRLDDSNKKTYFPSPQIIHREGYIHDSLLKGNYITTQTLLVKKECFEKAGMFDESLPRLQDWELVIRISKLYQFKCIDEPLVISYYQSQSISANQKALIRALELILEKHLMDFKINKRLLACHFAYLGDLLCSSGEFSKGRRYFLRAVKTYPLTIKYPGAILSSLFGKITYNIMSAHSRNKSE